MKIHLSVIKRRQIINQTILPVHAQVKPIAGCKYRLYAGVFMLTLLSACTLAPKYERPTSPISILYPATDVDIASEQTKVTDATHSHPSHTSSDGDIVNSDIGNTAAAGTQAKAGDSLQKNKLQIIPNFPASEIGWHHVFSDPQLQALIRIALNNNRDLHLAMLKVAEMRAQYQIQRADLLPQLSAKAGMSRSRTPAEVSVTQAPVVGSQFNVDAVASWEIDFFGRIQSLKSSALNQYLASEQAQRAAKIALVSTVAQQYLNWRAAEAQLAVTKNTLNNRQESLRINQAQSKYGVGDELVLSQAEGLVRQAEADLAAQKRAYAQSMNQLVVLIGQPLPEANQLPAAQSLADQTIVADLPAGLPSNLLLQRPDILQAEYLLKAANANIGAARAAFFPSISLTGMFGTASTALGGLFKAGTAAWQFAPSINLPIFNAGSHLANLKVAEVRKNMAVAQYEKTIQEAFREVADSLVARETFEQQQTAAQKNVVTQQKRFKLATLRYETGTDDYLQVLTAQTDFYLAQQNQINTKLNQLSNLILLYQRLGGGWID